MKLMKLNRSVVAVLASASLLVLSGCGSSGDTALDLYLQSGDSHEAISDAQVTAQVDLPDGTQQSLDMDYDTEGRHYTALIPNSAPGEYKIAVLSDIGGEKVNGRFSFTKQAWLVRFVC